MTRAQAAVIATGLPVTGCAAPAVDAPVPDPDGSVTMMSTLEPCLEQPGVSTAAGGPLSALAFTSAFDGEGMLMADLGWNVPSYTAFLVADDRLASSQLGPADSVDELRGLVVEHLGAQL